MNSTDNNKHWIEVGPLNDIPQLGARVVETKDGDVAIFRNSNDEIFALHDHCPHNGGPLSQGIVHGKRVTCPLHYWVIGMDDGEAVAPDVGCTNTYEVKLEGDKVYLNTLRL